MQPKASLVCVIHIRHELIITEPWVVIGGFKECLLRSYDPTSNGFGTLRNVTRHVVTLLRYGLSFSGSFVSTAVKIKI